MKFLICIICVISGINFSPVFSDENKVTDEVLSVIPMVVVFQYKTDGDKPRGITLFFQVSTGENNSLLIDDEFIEKNKTVSAVDSTGKNLGKMILFTQEELRRNNEENKCFVIAMFSELPAEGAQWIKLTGKIPIDVFSKQKETEVKTIRKEQGKEVETGSFILSMVDHTDTSYRFGYKKNRKSVKFGRMNFYNKDGGVIEPLSIDDFNYSRDGWDGVYGAHFGEGKVSDLNISVVYWDSPIRYEYPVDLKFNFSTKKKEHER